MNILNARSLALTCAVILAAIVTSSTGSKQQAQVGKESDSTKPTVSAPTQSHQSEIRDLTARLAKLNARYQLGDQAERASALEEIKTVAASRREMLAALIKSDPAEVLRVALPEGFGSNLPSEVRGSFEQHVDLEGKLEVLYACGERESELSHFLQVASKRLALHFAGSVPEDLLTDDVLRVKGVQVGEEIALEYDGSASSSTSLQTTSPSIAPNTFGEQRVLVLLVNFQDNQSQPWTADQVRSLVFGSVNDFYKESSYQQTWLAGDVFGWYTLPIAATCTESTIGTYAKQAATAAGINLSVYNRLVYAYPSVACGWTGSSTVGGNPSQSWINGSMILRTLGHELGHGLGLYHARAMDCGSEVIGGTCSTIEYGDVIDILGQSGITGESHAAQKERLGWLNYGVSPPITTVQTSGTYFLDPYETAGSNPKALKILRSTDPMTGISTWYYIEFRRPLGFDSFVSAYSGTMNGVMIHTSADPYSRENYLLDMTPSTSSFSDAALTIGHSYNDPTGNVTITPVSISSGGASVSVNFGPQPCVQANPSMTLSPSSSQWLSAGSTVVYQVSLTNNNSVCGPSDFSLQANIPNGWTAAFDCPSVTLAAGSSTTAYLSVTSPASAADGFYDVSVLASSNSAPNYAISGSVTFAVMSSLGVSVMSSQTSYTRSQTASVTAMVKAAGSPAAGASVTFIMTKPNGTKVTGSVSAAADGSAVFKYRFNNKKDPTGIYQVEANASMNGAVGSGSTSFTVK